MCFASLETREHFSISIYLCINIFPTLQRGRGSTELEGAFDVDLCLWSNWCTFNTVLAHQPLLKHGHPQFIVLVDVYERYHTRGQTPPNAPRRRGL